MTRHIVSEHTFYNEHDIKLTTFLRPEMLIPTIDIFIHESEFHEFWYKLWTYCTKNVCMTLGFFKGNMR